MRLLFLAAISLLLACDRQAEPLKNQTPNKAGRIVSLAPHVTELVFAVGAGDRLVGTVEYSDYPPHANDVLRIGDAFRIDYEQLEVLQPDLVIGWESGNPKEMIDRIRGLGYRVELIDALSLDEVAAQVEQVGTYTGNEAQAEELVTELRQQLQDLRNQEVPGDRQKVFWQISAAPYYTVAGDHVLTEVIELCGGRNIFTDISGMAAPVSLESILARNPDVIIAAVNPVSDAWQVDWKKWSELPAVSEEQLYTINSDLVSRPGPRLIQGANEVCSLLSRKASD